MSTEDELGVTLAVTNPASGTEPVSLPPMFVPGGKRYEYERRLGEGGMGVVELQRDQRIGRSVAMKILRPELVDDLAQRRFLREAQLQGQLEHPAIAPVYDLGEGRDGAVYFTMKRIRGVTLHEVLQGQRKGDPEFDNYTRRRLLGAFAQACLAIHFAHSRGVCHRDLKPANIMLGDFGEVYVLDWGIAKVGETPDGEPIADAPLAPSITPPTQLGSVLGTPGYMAPEQLRGERVAPTTDVYALGAILFEILTLQPFHPRGKLSAIKKSTFEPGDLRPSVRAPGREIPLELDEACEGALAQKPEDRYRDARALHDAVERFLDGERDLAARRIKAAEHATAVFEALSETEHASPEAELAARRNAMKEIGKALALDPENGDVLGVLAQLLDQDPKMTPPEVEAALDLGERVRLRKVAKFGAAVYFSLWALLPLWFWMGVAEVWPLVAIYGAFTVAGIASLLVWRHPAPQSWLPMIPMVASNVGFAAGAWLLGPFLVLPTASVVNTTAYAIHVSRARRPYVFAFGLLSFLVPVGLELAGLVPASFRSTDGGLLLVPRALDFPPAITIAVVVVIQVIALILAAFAIGIVRDYIDGTERKTYTYAWHLREFVPDSHKHRTDPIGRDRSERVIPRRKG